MSIFGKYDSISYDEDTSDIDLQNSTSNTFAWDVQYDEDMDEDADEEIDGYANVDPNIDAIDQLWSLVGLHDIKSRFYDIKAKVDVAGRQKMRLENEKFNAVFMGNPGTGKSTVLPLYDKFLRDIGVINGGGHFFLTTGPRLAFDGIGLVMWHLSELRRKGGGTFIVDDADYLVNNEECAAVVDFLSSEMKLAKGTTVFIFAGANNLLQNIVPYNPGVQDQFPYCFQFPDFTEWELLALLQKLIFDKYPLTITVEEGLQGRYIGVLIRRLVKGRGREGFGNARALANAWGQVMENQARRLEREEASGLTPNYRFFTKEDIIGPEPSSAVRNSAAWKELMALTGLRSIKESIHVFVDRMQVNYNRELEGKPPVEASLNRVFVGSPGTGKTTVAKLYGRILADIGLLSSPEVIVKSATDFLGQCYGESENRTKSILKAAEGKVLVIDEAYMLDPGRGDMNFVSYRKGIVDALVGGIQSVPGEDRCVLLLGYKEEMEEMFQNSNPGLARRFQPDHAFHFEDFDEEQLNEILESKLRQQDIAVTEEAKTVAMEVLAKARSRPNFGNAGEVENLINRAKSHHQKRKAREGVTDASCDIVFEPQDFDPDLNRGERSCRRLFSDVIGFEDIIQKLEAFHRVAENMRARELDPRNQIPFNFIFKGPPGTGKTTTARKMGQVFYDMGMLDSADVLECSASDLIGEYIGQTGPKTAALLTRGLGNVLFIDEAYRLNPGGRYAGEFAAEALGELVDCLTKPKFKANMVVILAGYTDQMDELLLANPGLSSRFPEEIFFHSLTPCQSIKLLLFKLEKAGISLQQTDGLKEDSSREAHELFLSLAALPSWGNGRDIETISKNIIGHVLRTADPNPESLLAASDEEILLELRNMLQQIKSRYGNVSNTVTQTQQKPPPNSCCALGS